ncbi:MAG: DnaD domain protein [Nanoarchaeota archaeon]
MDILDLLKSDGSIVINKKLTHKIGILENIVLSELISQYKYFQSKNELDEEGYFYCTVKKMKKHTALTKDQQNKAIKKLINLNLIKKDLRGLPAKRNFYICEDNILKLFLDNSNKNNRNPDDSRHIQVEDNPPTGSRKNLQLDSKNSSSINNNRINNLEEEEKTRTGTRKNNPHLSQKIINKFEEVFSRKPTRFELKQLLATEYNKKEKLIIKALEMTGLNSKDRTIGYTIALLSDWAKKNLKSVKEVEKMIDDFKKNQKSKSQSKKRNKYISNKKTMEELYKSGYK